MLNVIKELERAGLQLSTVTNEDFSEEHQTYAKSGLIVSVIRTLD